MDSPFPGPGATGAAFSSRKVLPTATKPPAKDSRKSKAKGDYQERRLAKQCFLQRADPRIVSSIPATFSLCVIPLPWHWWGTLLLCPNQWRWWGADVTSVILPHYGGTWPHQGACSGEFLLGWCEDPCICAEGDIQTQAGVLQPQGNADINHSNESELSPPTQVSGWGNSLDKPPWVWFYEI